MCNINKILFSKIQNHNDVKNKESEDRGELK